MKNHQIMYHIMRKLSSIFVKYFALAIWPVTGQGFQNTKLPAVQYFQQI